MITISRRGLLVTTGYLLAASAFPASAAETTVNVSLWDRGPDSGMMDDAHLAMMGRMNRARMGMEMMGVTVDRPTVPAGTVTFAVTNDSKSIIHEMIVAPLPEGATELPYLGDENRVDEEAAHSLGEVSELDPGKGGALTLDLSPGNYILFCNIPGHFALGMWTLLSVSS